MQKTDFQRTGYLSRRSENGTWSNRYISLSTDTGAMKFYVEKSGKKTMKSQVNIKKGKLTPLTVEATGKPFAFQLMMEELIGKSDDANLTLAAADETQYNEWVEDITSCFSITDARRRKSALVTAPTDILQPVVEPTVAPTPAEPIVAAPISTNPLLEELKAVHQRKSISEVSAESLTNENPFLKSENPLGPTDDLPPRSAPLERTPSKEEKKDGNSTPKHRYETIEVIVTSDSEDGNSVKKSSKLSSRAASPSPKNEATNTNPELEEKLEKLGKRKSYKPPKKLGNILNSKGLTPEMEEEIKKVKEGPSEEKKIEFEGIAVVEEPPAPKPRQLVISVRPTSPIREGYLFKFDHTPKEELGEDPWIQQFVSLEISTGILQFYAELGGRRIARGKINIIESTVEPIDLVFHGRLYAFKLISGPEKTVSTLAAEDLESFSYWLISFDDCFKYIDDMKEKKLREEEEKKALEMQRMQLAASMARSRSGSELGTSALDRKSSFRTDGSHNMERKTSFRENSEKTLEKKNSMRLDHLEQHISHQPVDDKELLKERLNDSVVTAKVVNHNYFEDPTPLSRPPSFKTKESTFAADDLTPLVKEKEKSRSRSFTTAPGTSVGPIMQLNEKNSIDDLLRFDPDLPPFSRDNSVSNRSRRDSEHEMMEIKGMEFTLKKSTYPADRLARRVKIWYCSGGFSLSTEDEINQFVDALKNTDDPTLKAFSEEKFEHINDWSNLLEVLRKYEQKMLAEMANNDVAIESAASNQNHVKFVYEITIPSRNREEEKVEFEFTDEFDFEALVKKLSEVFGYSELSLFACVPPLLANKESPWCRGLVTVKEDLLFAEDLVLYQEEVIEHMWDSYSALKQMIEQKDEVINQLYNQLSDLQDKVTQSQSVQQTLFSGGFASSSYHSLKSKQSTKELQVIADREFYAADKDGDGRISREEWRNWIQDKHNLVQEHNEVKTVLMNEIKTLRKAMTPQQEQQYNELKKSDDIRIKQEEELVRIHIENDKLKAEVSLLQQRLQEMEEEKNMVESDLQEKIESLQKQLETAINMNHFGDGERNGMSDPSAREISAASNLIDSPYAYNYALDRSTGITAKKKERPSIGATGNGVGDNMDLLALANMNDKFIAQLDGSDFIQTTNRSFNQAQANQTNLKENNNGKPWHLETYPGEMSRLGVDPLPTPPSHLVNVYPQTLALRSPDDEDFYGQVNRPATAQSYLNNLQDNQQNGRNGSRGRDPSRFTLDEANNNNNYNQYGVVPRASNSTTSTSRRPISPSVVHNTLASVYDHPLRNALRQETKPSFASAPSPYTSVRSRVSTTNYNHTINSKMKPTRLKTGTMINDKVVANPAASLGPRNPSPNRVPRGHQNRDDTIYEYSNRLPSSNPQGGDRPNSPSRFMLNTNSWKQKINTPHQPPDMVIRAGNWK